MLVVLMRRLKLIIHVMLILYLSFALQVLEAQMAIKVIKVRRDSA